MEPLGLSNLTAQVEYVQDKPVRVSWTCRSWRSYKLLTGIAVIRQRCHEHVGRDNFTGICVNNGSGVAGSVYPHDLTGLVIQMYSSIRLRQIICVILVELGGLVRDLARYSALVAVFQPQQIQGDSAALELFVDIGVVGHLVDGLRAAGQEQTFRELFVRQRPLQAAVRCPLQRCCHGVPSGLAACGNLGFVESQAVKPEDLAVIGHVGDLFVDIYTANAIHIYILPPCSTTAARMLNPARMSAQLERLRCAISRGILTLLIRSRYTTTKTLM